MDAGSSDRLFVPLVVDRVVRLRLSAGPPGVLTPPGYRLTGQAVAACLRRGSTGVRVEVHARLPLRAGHLDPTVAVGAVAGLLAAFAAGRDTEPRLPPAQEVLARLPEPLRPWAALLAPGIGVYDGTAAQGAAATLAPLASTPLPRAGSLFAVLFDATEPPGGTPLGASDGRSVLQELAAGFRYGDPRRVGAAAARSALALRPELQLLWAWGQDHGAVGLAAARDVPTCALLFSERPVHLPGPPLPRLGLFRLAPGGALA